MRFIPPQPMKIRDAGSTKVIVCRGDKRINFLAAIPLIICSGIILIWMSDVSTKNILAAYGLLACGILILFLRTSRTAFNVDEKTISIQNSWFFLGITPLGYSTTRLCNFSEVSEIIAWYSPYGPSKFIMKHPQENYVAASVKYIFA